VEYRSEPEHTILVCKCEEKIVLLGSKDDWRSRRAVFRCSGCGRRLTLNKHTEEKILTGS
jgi:hypothetical protein